MISRSHLSTLVYIAFALWAVILTLRGVSLPTQWRDPLPWVITGLLGVVWCFDQWLWRLPLVRAWFGSPPNLRGTWKATLRSNWVDPSGQRIAPIEAYAVIRQTYSSLFMRLLTKESSSESLAAAFDHASDGGWSLVTVYRNTPGPFVVHRSRPHFGGVILSGRGRRPTTLQGQYWTDRDTRGELHMTSRNRRLLNDFASASGVKYR